MPKKKILFIIWSYTYGGGAERILSNIVNNIDKEKYDVAILEYWHSDINEEKTDPRVKILPPVVDSTKASKVRMLITKILLEHFPNVLRKKFIKEKYDYEISFNSLIPTFLLPKDGKTISWNHGDLYKLNEKNRKRDKKMQYKSFSHIKKIVAISKNTYKSIITVYPEFKDKTSLIYNGYDFNAIKKLAEAKKINKKKFTLLYVGRLDTNKNPMYLLDIAHKLKQNNFDFNFWFVGKGNLKDEMQAKIKEYNLEDNVELLGFIPNPYPYFKTADVLTLSSVSEGFPTVIVEALALGKPFISTTVGGADELSHENECGFVAKTKDEYYEYAKQLINNPKLYEKMHQNALKYVEEYTITNQLNKLYKLLDELDQN